MLLPCFFWIIPCSENVVCLHVLSAETVLIDVCSSVCGCGSHGKSLSQREHEGDSGGLSETGHTSLISSSLARMLWRMHNKHLGSPWGYLRDDCEYLLFLSVFALCCVDIQQTAQGWIATFGSRWESIPALWIVTFCITDVTKSACAWVFCFKKGHKHELRMWQERTRDDMLSVN